jgi:eukaryotic-like serine/threonine-protein kinase
MDEKISARGAASPAARFDELWDGSDSPPDVLTFLASLPDASPHDRLDVLLVDQHRRSRAGRRLPAEDYLRACPDIASDPALKLDLVYGELRSTGGSLDPYATRFPELCESLARQSAIDAQVRSIQQTIATTRASDPDVAIPAISDDGPGLPGFDGPPGSPARGRFSIRRQLGAGGMGVVYRAYDRQRGEPVALKTMRWADPAALYRFKHEFRALADLAHPNLVTLHELICVGDQWCFTMELVDGVDFLRHVRPDGGPPHLDRLRRALAQLAEGLRALHEAGLVHRDLKPSNVLVDRRGRVVILDFGLVADLERPGGHASTDGRVVGTPLYMAPEQAAGRAAAPAGDWYSVGAMLYEALAGRPPFDGSPLEVLMAKQSRDPPPLGALAPDVPADLDALCVDLLRREPESRPSGADVLRRLGGAAPPAPAEPPRAATPLVGRERHLAALAEAFAAVERGRTVLVAVSGRSGAGKSALVQHFLDDLTARDAAVILPGRCYEREAVPYKAVDSLIDALSRHLGRLPAHEVGALLPRDVHPLARVFPVLRRVEAIATAPRLGADASDPIELRRRAFAGLRELLARLGDRRPLVLTIDDLQWGDFDSATLLADLLRLPDPPVLLAIGCYRAEDEQTSPFIRGLLQWRERNGEALDWRDLAVESLDQDAAYELAHRLLGRDGPHVMGTAEAIARESRGSPFFVHELVQAIRSHSDPLAGEVALDRVLLGRVALLPEDARRLLEVVAVAGRPVAAAVACGAAGLAAAGPAALGLLRSARLVRGTGQVEGGEVETYHDRIRETVAAHLTPTVSQQIHARLASALEASGRADPEFLAEHLQGAGDHDRAAGYYASAAAQAAEALAFDRAAKLYRRALDLRPWSTDDSRPLRVELGDALANAGRGREAAQEYLAAAAGAPATEATEWRRRAAMQYLIGGHIDEGLEALRVVLHNVGMELPEGRWEILASLLARRALISLLGYRSRQRPPGSTPAEALVQIDACWSAMAGLYIVDPARSALFQARNLLLARKAGDPYRFARALALEALRFSLGGWSVRARSRRILAAAADCARRVAHPHIDGLLPFMHGVVAYFEGRWKDATRYCDQAEAVFRGRCTGVWWEMDSSRILSLFSLFWSGDLAEIERRLPLVLADARERGDLYALVNHGTFTVPALRLAAGEPEAAREEVVETMWRWSQQGFHIIHLDGMCRLIDAELYSGEVCAAWERVARLVEASRGSMLLRVQFLRISVLHRHGCCALAAAGVAGDRGALLHAARKDARSIIREGTPYGGPMACYLRAGLAFARGDDERGLALLSEAVEGFEAVDMRLFAEATRRRLGEYLGGERGRALIVQADTWMASQGIRDPTRMAAAFAPGFPD